MSLTIRSKLIIAFLLSIVVAIGSVSAVVSIEIRRASLRDFEDSSSAQLERVNDFIATFFEAAQRNVVYMASLPRVVEAKGQVASYADTKQDNKLFHASMTPEEQALAKVLTLMGKANNWYDEIFIGYQDGGFISHIDGSGVPAGYDPRKRPWYKEAMASSGNTLISKAYLSTTGYPVASVMSKVRAGSGEIVGVMGVDINLSTLTKVTSNLRIGKTGYVMLVEDTSVILSDPRHEKFGFKKAEDTGVPAMAQIMKMQRGTFEAPMDGTDKLITVFTGYQGWKMAVVIDKAEVYAQSASVVNYILMVGAGIAVVLMVVAWLLARSVANPVQMLVAASGRVAAGEFDALPDARHFSGELLDLHGSLRAMVGNLGELLGTAKAKTAEAEEQTRKAENALREAEEARLRGEQARKEGIRHTAERLEGIVANVRNASHELAGQVDEARSGAEVQRARTAEAATAMEQMNASVLEVAANASRAAESAENARAEAEAGGAIVRDVVDSIRKVDEFARDMSGGLGDLGKRAEGIGNIMTVITDIADQTNLLALNAAIEAARAGDAGRGFAVVADEVRKLAEKTMTATKEVGDAITAIQRGTQDNITGMGRAAEVVQRSTDLASRAGEALARIVSIVESTADQVRSIATASEQQSAASEQINRGTDEVNRIASEMAEAMAQSTREVGELARLSSELQDVIHGLKEDS
ncbi:methyl-accepting chemotaxis protein [Nitratidesulfovibrio sp. D1]|uniref:methyl-accepting chemotaxis protein n=1 Tax=Nitratidesulfovibrio sp. D1 TaxID=3440151 RepID=UPI003EB773D2